MKVYEITVRIASAYADISEVVTSDGLANAIGGFIATSCKDAVDGERDIAVEISPVDPKVVYDSGEEEREDTRDSVCSDCAAKMGYVKKDKIIGVWRGVCEFCGEEKPLTSLVHDWRKESEVKDGK